MGCSQTAIQLPGKEERFTVREICRRCPARLHLESATGKWESSTRHHVDHSPHYLQTSMGDVHTADGLTIGQLLHTLRERFTSLVFVNPLHTLTTSTDIPPASKNPPI